MMQAAQIEEILRTHSLPGLEGVLPLDRFVLPHYDGYSIANLPATIAGLLGVEVGGEVAPPLPDQLWAGLADGVRQVLLIILDAVGYGFFRRELGGKDSPLRRLVDAGRLLPLTSVFPSTTVAALTTLRTGRPPTGHGFLGTRLLLAEQGVLADMISLGPAAHRQREALLDWGWDPETFASVPGLADYLTAAGVETMGYTYLPFVGSTLSRIFLGGMARVRGYFTFSDLWVNLRRTLDQKQGGRLFVSVYWSSIDTLSHLYGPDAEANRVELRHLLRAFEEDLVAPLPAAAREGTLLLVTADHGQLSTPQERVVYLADHPALRRSLLLPPAGETRAAYLYVRPGQAALVRDYVAEHLADRFLLLETDRALAAGLFGSQDLRPELRTRLGDFLLLAQDDSRLVSWEEKGPMLGHHGSLTPEEMLVPLLMARLDDGGG